MRPKKSEMDGLLTSFVKMSAGLSDRQDRMVMRPGTHKNTMLRCLALPKPRRLPLAASAAASKKIRMPYTVPQSATWLYSLKGKGELATLAKL